MIAPKFRLRKYKKR